MPCSLLKKLPCLEFPPLHGRVPQLSKSVSCLEFAVHCYSLTHPVKDASLSGIFPSLPPRFSSLYPLANFLPDLYSSGISSRFHRGHQLKRPLSRLKFSLILPSDFSEIKAASLSGISPSHHLAFAFIKDPSLSGICGSISPSVSFSQQFLPYLEFLPALSLCHQLSKDLSLPEFHFIPPRYLYLIKNNSLSGICGSVLPLSLLSTLPSLSGISPLSFTFPDS